MTIKDYLERYDIRAFKVRYDPHYRRCYSIDAVPKDAIKDGEICFVIKESDLLRLLKHEEKQQNESELELVDLS